MSKQKPLEEISHEVDDIAKSMTMVAKNIAMLGMKTDGKDTDDVRMKTITEENNKVLNHVRNLYNLPIPPAQK